MPLGGFERIGKPYSWMLPSGIVAPVRIAGREQSVMGSTGLHDDTFLLLLQ